MVFYGIQARRAAVRLAALVLACAACACGDAGDPGGTGTTTLAPEAATLLRMDFAAGGDFYASPFPGEHRRAANGAVDLTGFPNPDGIALVDDILAVVGSEADGFGTTSGVFFSLTGELDPAGLPDVPGSVAPDARVFLLDVDPSSPDTLARYPIQVGFVADGGPFGASNLLAVLPYQGVPLRPGTAYAVVVLRSLADVAGKPLGVSDSLASLLSGKAPEGLSADAASVYSSALEQIQAGGTSLADIAGLTVFRTGHPEARFEAVLGHALSGEIPAPAAPFELTDTFDDYCVFKTTIEIPTYQGGTPPYTTEGGGWVFGDDGVPQVQALELAEMVVTLPRSPMPAAGFPVVITSRTGMGGPGLVTPLVDMGPRPAPGALPPPGTGPALAYAMAGFAGLSIDGPHTGLRNISNGDPQFLVFNIQNPEALRDNVRQSAVDLALHAHVVKGVQIDASACPGLTTTGGGPALLDQGKIAAFGFSMGATILPLAVAHEPLIRAAILTGAGSSYVDNILYKKEPLETKGLAEVLLQYPGHDLELTELDPVLSLLQWGAEPADPPSYARRILLEPGGAEHHVLMLQGVVDHYILPPMANATALSFGLDLAGEPLDAQSEELAAFSPFLEVAYLSGRGQTGYPASGNFDAGGASPRTAVMALHPEDGIEDGHLVLFQTEGPRYQMKCFLQSFAQGIPAVPAPAELAAACP